MSWKLIEKVILFTDITTVLYIYKSRLQIRSFATKLHKIDSIAMELGQGSLEEHNFW